MGGLFVGMEKKKKKKKEKRKSGLIIMNIARMHRTLPNTSSLFPIPSRVYIIINS